MRRSSHGFSNPRLTATVAQGEAFDARPSRETATPALPLQRLSDLLAREHAPAPVPRAAAVHPDEPGQAPTCAAVSRPALISPKVKRDEAEPVTADLSRLHVTVSRRFLAKLAAARDALSHGHPGANREAVLEAGLDLLRGHRQPGAARRLSTRASGVVAGSWQVPRSQRYAVG